MNNKKTVVGIGEALFDVFPEGRKIGGAPANFAYHATLQGCDGIAVSAVGRDALGDEIESIFNASGLNCRLQRSEFPTGTVQVSVSPAGQPSYEIKENVAWDDIRVDDALAALAPKTDCVCFGSLAQRSATSRESIRSFIAAMPAGAMKVFDINLRQHYYSPELLRESLDLCNILKINDDELEIISTMFGVEGDDEKRARAIMERFGLRALILTCGTRGSYVFASGGQTSFLPTPVVEVVDTVGAGDSFTGAFVASALAGRSIAEAHRRAVDVSAFVCTRSGAMPDDMPDDLRG